MKVADIERESDELIELFEKLLTSMIEAMQANDWVEAGRINAIFRGISETLGDINLVPEFLEINGISYMARLPAPRV